MGARQQTSMLRSFVHEEDLNPTPCVPELNPEARSEASERAPTPVSGLIRYVRVVSVRLETIRDDYRVAY